MEQNMILQKKKKLDAPFYNIERMFDKNKKECSYSFGLGREYFKKTVIDNIVSNLKIFQLDQENKKQLFHLGVIPKYTIKRKTNPIGLTKYITTPSSADYNYVTSKDLGKYYLK